MKLGSKKIGKDNSIFFIAEAGINHNGDINNAKKLIDIAVSCGADCVKFQKRTVSDVFTKNVLDRDYSTSKNSFGNTYREHKLNCELSENNFTELKKYADKKNILFTASPWDKNSVDFEFAIDFNEFLSDFDERLKNMNPKKHLFHEHHEKSMYPRDSRIKIYEVGRPGLKNHNENSGFQ